MKHFYPDYYKKFKCIAAECPDSCCKDWDVVVDDESQAFYETVTDSFGKKLKSLTAVDGDGDRIFVSQNSKCPFWNNQGLCDIYINLGEEHLCSTCRSFPRISQDYTAFCEHMLSFACPEAARLMLEADKDFCYQTVICPYKGVDYSVDMMNFLLKARKSTFEILNNLTLPFAERLRKILAFNVEIQNRLDNENYVPFDFSQFITPPVITHKSDCSFIFDLHKRLDIMSKNWLSLLENAASHAYCGKISDRYDKYFSALAKYYIFRYYLIAIDSFNVLSAIKRIVCAYTVIGHMLSSAKDLTANQQILVIQRYSKEVEHSYENSELLEDEFLFNPDFSAGHLLKVI